MVPGYNVYVRFSHIQIGGFLGQRNPLCTELQADRRGFFVAGPGSPPATLRADEIPAAIDDVRASCPQFGFFEVWREGEYEALLHQPAEEGEEEPSADCPADEGDEERPVACPTEAPAIQTAMESAGEDSPETSGQMLLWPSD